FLRLAFHDAATREDSSSTGGPNGSIKYELDWSENRGLSRPLKVIEQIHAEIVRNLNISLADTIALAGAQAVQAARGPTISIRLGRRDATKADERNRRNNLQSDTTGSLVDTTLPSAGLDSEGLRLYFGALGLSDKEFVALCGAHDLGRHCLENAPMLMPFVAEEPDTFSNSYFLKLLKWNDRRVALGEVAFIPTDVDLVVDEGLRRYVKHFARDKAAFYSTFATAYRKLVEPGTT
ncbi:peroxisomal ascorbate peroxidase, partial [Thalassiosira pseudonana CCMP1335]